MDPRTVPYRPYVQLDSGLIVPDHYDPTPPRPTGVDLFCGCGGFSLGMIRGGLRVVAACDSDAAATATYLVNLGEHPVRMHFLSEGDEARFERFLKRHGGYRTGPGGETVEVPLVSGSNRDPGVPGVGHFFFGDVRRLTGKMILDALGMERGDLDCVFGGPPCQGFSTAGRRNVMDPRNSLVFEFTRLVCELQPRTMCLENVPAMASMVTPEGLPVVEALCLSLAKGGFGTLESLKRALGADQGRRAAVRGRGRGEAQEVPPPPAQGDLFG